MGKLKLFQVPIEGIEKGDVEALPSYLFRLAHEHSVSIRRLIAFIKYHSSCDRPQWEYSILDVSVRAWVALYPRAMDLTPTIQALTEQPILSGTTRVFGGHKTSITDFFRWCPFCLDAMLKSGRPPYFKLIWMLADVVNCHIHDVELFSNCHHCGARQNMRSRSKSLHFCQNCGKSLCDKYVYRYVKREKGISELDLFLLFKSLALNNYELIEKEMVEASCNDLLDIYESPDLRLSGTKVRRARLLESVISFTTPPNLARLRQVANEYEIPLYSLLKGEAKYVTCALGLDVTVLLYEPKHFSELSAGNWHEDNSYIYKKARDIQRRFACAASLDKLAERLSTSVDCLQKRAPSLCAHFSLEQYTYSQKNLETVTEFVRAFLVEQLWNYSNKDPGKLKAEVLGELQYLTALDLQTLYEIYEDVLESLRY